MNINPRILFALFVLPLSFAEDPVSRVIDPKRNDPVRLAPRENVQKNFRFILREGSLRKDLVHEPYSDRIWAANRGLILERYNDPNHRRLDSWPSRRDYNNKFNAQWMLQQPDRELRDRWIASLSPAEKYDLAVGTLEGGLADALKEYLNSRMDSRGRFPTWWGLCEGSAAASISYTEPTRALWVRSEAYNVDIPFYAPDIKGLASMLWSLFNENLRLPELGYQCRESEGGNLPDGVTKEATCFDVNPGSFHVALHHFVGLGKGKLLADLDASSAVWNYPIVGYEMDFYRPDVWKRTDFQGAILPVGEWSRDPNRELRAPGTAYIVGVAVDVKYAVNHREIPLQGSKKRHIETKQIRYELELDSNFTILGGEWRSSRHPDLLWTIPERTIPNSVGDRMIPQQNWDGRSVPANWASAARASAAKVTPLRVFVEGLIRRSAVSGN